MESPSWQSTLIGLALIALVGGIFIVVFEKDGTSDALEVWAALGTLVGVLVGAVPTYFFSKQATVAANEEVQRTRDATNAQLNRLHDTLDLTQAATNDALKTQTGAEERAKEAEEKAAILRTHVPEATFNRLQEARRDLFA